MQESCPYGSVRGAPSNGCPYRNREIASGLEASSELGPIDCRRGGIIQAVVRLGKTNRAVAADQGPLIAE